MSLIAKSYRINLIRSQREREKEEERKHRMEVMSGIGCFVLLMLVIAYSGFTIWKMEKVLAAEKRKVDGIRSEYQKYTATRTIVDKGDVELLNNLQGRGIFWTKKLAALANHLPDNYIIKGFSYREGELKVSGHGNASSRQDQLLILDGYLKRLRSDSTFSNVFSELYLNTAFRQDEVGEGRIGFEFSCINPKVRKNK